MKKTASLILCLMLLAGVFVTGVSAADAQPGEAGPSAYDLAGQKIASITGSPTDGMILDFFDEDVTVEYYSTHTDMTLALDTGKVAAYVCDLVTARRMLAACPGQVIMEPCIKEMDVGFLFNKDDPESQELCDKMAAFIERCRADGTYDELNEKWMGLDPDSSEIDIELTGENGTLSWACSTSVGQPWCFLREGEYVGFEVELATRFCQEYGYALEMTDFDIGGMINAVVMGKCDFGGTGTCITPEREESVRFSGVNYTNRFVLVTREDGAANRDGGFFRSVADSFNKTFLRESRWKLIARGILTTLEISVFAALLGTVLGFGLCLMRRLKNPVAHGFTSVYIRVLQGTPILVLLMILYYVVFGKSGVNGVIVAIIAFALNFAAYVCEMFRTGIESVDVGQTEAALALGYTKKQAFLRIVLPQAAEKFLPVYKGEFVSLMKMTSIVGYIAVQDLTKMSDIIRSRTYEAFFPLIATAVIYFVLSALLTGALKAVEIRVEPDRKNRAPKGVVTE